MIEYKIFWIAKAKFDLPCVVTHLAVNSLDSGHNDSLFFANRHSFEMSSFGPFQYNVIAATNRALYFFRFFTNIEMNLTFFVFCFDRLVAFQYKGVIKETSGHILPRFYDYFFFQDNIMSIF